MTDNNDDILKQVHELAHRDLVRYGAKPTDDKNTVDEADDIAKAAIARYNAPPPTVPVQDTRTPEQIEEEELQKKLMENPELAKAFARRDSAEAQFMRHLVENASFGVTDIIRQHISTPAQLEADELADEKHPIAHWTGSAAGLASTLAFGGLATKGGQLAERAALEGFEQGAARTIAGKAIQLGTEGAIYSTPAAATYAYYGEKDKAAETLLAGGGLGVVLGGLTGAAEVGGSRISAALNDTSRSVNDALTESISKSEASKAAAAAAKQEAFDNFLNTIDDRLEAHNKQTSLFGMDDPLDKSKIIADLDKANTPEFKVVADNDPATKDFVAKVQEHLNTIDDFESSIKARNAIADLETTNSSQAEFKKAALSVLKSNVDEAVNKTMSTLKNDEVANKAFEEYIAQMSKKTFGEEVQSFITDKDNVRSAVKGAARVAGLKFGGFGGAYVADKLSEGIADRVAEPLSKWLSTKIGSKIAENLTEDGVKTIGLSLTKKAVDTAAENIQTLGESLIKGKPIINAAVRINAVKHPLVAITGSNSKNQQAQFLRAVDIVNEKADDPQTFSHIGQLAGVFHHDDQLANNFSAKSVNALQYLKQTIPKSPLTPQPFSKNEYIPPPIEQKSWMDKLHIVQDPYSVITLIHNSQLNKSHIEALKAVYPLLYQDMVNAIIQNSYHEKSVNLPLSTKLTLSRFTGLPLDQSLQSLPQLQSTYQKAQPQQQQPIKAPRNQHAKLNKLPKDETNTQRLENK